jgi:hypothetical protein
MIFFGKNIERDLWLGKGDGRRFYEKFLGKLAKFIIK